MKVYTVTVGKIIPTNAYFYIDERTKHGFLIDAGDEADVLMKKISDNGWTIEKILLTHGHFDHIGAVEKLSQKLNVPYYIHQNGRQYLTDANYNLSACFGEPIELMGAHYFVDGDKIALKTAENTALKVLHTPGHTADSVVLYDEESGIAFCGDTIFKSSIGRTDVPGGSSQQLWRSIEKKIFTLPKQTVLYSGHTAPTTVGAEQNFWQKI